MARRYATVTGEEATDRQLEEMIETGESEQIFQRAILEQGRGAVQDTLSEIDERHRSVKQVERGLLELQQVFLDLATVVDQQGEVLDNIEKETVEINIKYDGFIKRAEHQRRQMASKEHKEIPEGIDYSSINIISMEAREKLAKFQPRTIGQAARIGGVNPSDIQALLLHMEVSRRKASSSEKGKGPGKVPNAKEAVQSA